MGDGDATLDGRGAAGATLTIEPGVSALVTGFRITGGNSDELAGGIDVLSAHLTLRHSTVFGNKGCTGGGIAVLGSTATIANSTVRDNLASCSTVGVGGGIEVCDTLCGYAGETSLALFASTIGGNTALEGVGGGIDIVHAHATVSASRFRNNAAYFTGGGLNNQVGSDLVVSHSSFRNNLARGGGGGLMNDIAEASVSDSVFDHNAATGLPSGLGVGGAIDNLSEPTFTVGDLTVSGSSSLQLSRSVFTNNSAIAGGGISNVALGGEPATLSGDGLVVRANSAADWAGGVFNQDEGGGALLTLRHAVVRANRAQYGGGLLNNGGAGHATLRLNSGTRVTQNRALVAGGGIDNINAGLIQVRHTLVFGNRPENCLGC